MISLKQIEKTYYGQGVETRVLKNLELEIQQGEFVCIYGSSGSGKSTLLNIIGLLDEATSGIYELDGTDVNTLGEREKARTRNQKLGFVFQAYHLIPELNALENIVLPLGYAGVGRAERNKAAGRLLEEFGMLYLKNKYISQMSGGEQQRIAIMRAMANQPKILLADEPTGNLDSENSEMAMGLLGQLNQSGTTIVMVTHDTALAQYGSRVIHVEDGRIKKSKSPMQERSFPILAPGAW